MSGVVKKVLLATLLGVALYGAFAVYAGIRNIGDTLSGFAWISFGGALGLSCANYLLRFAKWEFYLARLGIREIPKLESLLVFLSGFVLTVTPGKIGEVFKSAVLARTHRVAMARTAPIVVAERLTDVIGVVALILLGSVGFDGGLMWAAIGGGLVLVGLALIALEWPARVLITTLRRAPGRLPEAAPKLELAFHHLRILCNPRALLVPALLSLLAWGCECVGLYVLLRGFRADAPLSLSAFFYATATLAGAVVPVPGGLGVTETMLQEQLVRLAGIPLAVATASMLLVRIATLWWAVLVGFGALGVLRAKYPGLLDANEWERMPREGR